MNIQVKIGDQIFEVEVGDLSTRPILVKVDCDTFEVWPEIAETPVPLPFVQGPVQTLPLPAAKTPAPVRAAPVGNMDKNKIVSAPIPGAIIAVTAKPGMEVTQGQELCLLEAMKMKNAIRSTRSGTIAAVLVNVGDHVTKGQPLIEFTD